VNGTLPKYLVEVRSDPRVADVADRSATADGFWIWLEPGFVCTALGTHWCHDWTIPALRMAFASVRPCACEECTAIIELENK